MDKNATMAIVLGILFGGIALVVITAIVTGAVSRHLRNRRSEGLSVDEWAARLHSLAQALKDAEGLDEQTAGRVLLDHAHLLRPGAKHCGCARPIGPVSSRNIITEADV